LLTFSSIFALTYHGGGDDGGNAGEPETPPLLRPMIRWWQGGCGVVRLVGGGCWRPHGASSTKVEDKV